jgi:hypothetical protein
LDEKDTPKKDDSIKKTLSSNTIIGSVQKKKKVCRLGIVFPQRHRNVEKVLALLMQKRTKTIISELLRSRSYIPVSLRSTFELTASQEVRGSTEFFHLLAASSVAMSTCIEEIKGYMADVADMENKIFDTKIHELLFAALDDFTRLWARHQNEMHHLVQRDLYKKDSSRRAWVATR